MAGPAPPWPAVLDRRGFVVEIDCLHLAPQLMDRPTGAARADDNAPRAPGRQLTPCCAGSENQERQ